MTISDPEMLTSARATLARLAPQGLTPSQARLYSQYILLSLQQPGLPTFNEKEAWAHFEDAQLLLDAAVIARDLEGSDDWRRALKRAGEIFEWIAHDNILGSHIEGAILFAAAAYQIAGYPALARGMLAISSNKSEGPGQLLRLFLAANFPLLFLHTVQHLGMTATADQPEGEDPAERIGRAIIIETARCLGIIASAMRWGDDERIEVAINKLRAIATLALHSAVPHSGVIAQLAALAARQYEKSNLWRSLRRLSEGQQPDVRLAYEGFGKKSYLRAKSLTWQSQLVGIDKLISSESFVLCTPTGSGKTMIAELALLGALCKDSRSEEESEPRNAPLSLYLVPSRALAAEVEHRLHDDLSGVGPRGIVVTGLYGGTDWGPTDAWLTSAEPTVLVCTYEKAEALMRFLGPIFIRRISAIIIDEAHFVQFTGNSVSLRAGDSRSLRLEALAVRMLRALDGCNYRLIALSAVTAGLEGSLAQWLVGNEAIPARSDYVSTRQLVGRLECIPDGGFNIFYDLVNRTDFRFQKSVGRPGKTATTTPYIPRPFPARPPSVTYDGKGVLLNLRPYLVWAALQIARLGEDGHGHTVLVSVASHIRDYVDSFLQLLEVDWKNETLPPIFSQPTAPADADMWSKCKETMKDYFTDQSAEYRLLQHGIAVHHGRMPALLARRIKSVVESRIVRVVIATSTLSEGVNLPVDYILVPSLYRGQDPIPKQEFLNLIGRAGRPGFGTEGRTLVLIPSKPWSRGDRWLARGYQNMLQSIRVSATSTPPATRATSALARLLELIAEEWRKLTGSVSDDDFAAWLDSTRLPERTEESSPVMECLDSLDSILIAAIEEVEQLRSSGPGETERAELEARLQEIWHRSFAKVAADAEERLAKIFLLRGKAIPTLYPDGIERRRIYRTSLPPVSARMLLAQHAAIVDELKSGGSYGSWDSDKRFQFIETIVGLVYCVPRFAPPTQPGKKALNWKCVLRWWLDPGGASERPSADDIGAWHEYVTEYFVYKAAWGVGSVLSLCFESLNNVSNLAALSLADWPKSGLPWIAFWIKELLTWGTLDPVAAFLMVRGDAVTRAAAEVTAQEYYKARSYLDDGSLLDPRTIRDWAQASKPFQTTSRHVGRHSAQLDVKLVRPATDFRFHRLRVFPHATTTGIVQWFDLAGYHVATGEVQTLDAEWSLQDMDFVLDTTQSKIFVSRYLDYGA